MEVMSLVRSQRFRQAVVIDDGSRSRGAESTGGYERARRLDQRQVPRSLLPRPDAEDHLLPGKSEIQLGVESGHEPAACHIQLRGTAD
jgi:hypothetical protein